jgi:hypothetical protein
MGLFAKKIAEAKENSGGVYWLPGQYVVEIAKVAVVEGRKGDEFFVVEGKNIQSNNPERPVGATCSWVVNTDLDAAPGNIKQFISAAGQCDASEVDEDSVEASISSDNPLCGEKVSLTVVTIKTKAGNDFSKHVWSQYKGK